MEAMDDRPFAVQEDGRVFGPTWAVVMIAWADAIRLIVAPADHLHMVLNEAAQIFVRLIPLLDIGGRCAYCLYVVEMVFRRWLTPAAFL